jgi:acyl carrier protein
VQVVRDGDALRLAARPAGGDAEWLVHAEAAVARTGNRGTPDVGDAPVPWVRVDSGFVRERLAAVGVPDTGFAWTVERTERADGRLRTRVRATDASTWASVLDAVMSVAPCAFPGEPELRMVVRTDDLRLVGSPPAAFEVDVRVDPERTDTADAVVTTLDGSVVAIVTGLRYPVIGRLAGAGEPDRTDQADESTDRTDRLGLLTPEQLRDTVLAEVSAEIATEMRLAVAELELRRPLVELGLDSVMTVVIRRRLQKRFGQELPTTLFWQQPTVAAIGDHITGLLLAERDTPPADVTDVAA